MKHLALLMLPVCSLLFSCTQQNSHTQNNFNVQPSVFQPETFDAPAPEKKPKQLVFPSGDTTTDYYYWLNERENPAVVAYLEAENKYADSVLAPVSNLRNNLYEEMIARIKQDDNSAPYFKNGYWYYNRFENGKEYPLLCRKKGSLDAAEEIMLDVNQLAQGRPYCLVANLVVSPDNRLAAYAVDYTGRNLFRVYIKNLENGQLLPDEFDSAFGAMAWSSDGKTILYDTKDPVTLRTDKVWRHAIGSPAASDVMMYEEKDETLYCNLTKSKSEKYFFINLGYTQNEATLFLSADNPTGKFELITPREPGHYYTVEHWNDRFVIRTNWQSKNFRIMETPVGTPQRDNWKDVLPPREAVLVSDFTVFQDYLVTEERKDGLKQLHILHRPSGKDHYINIGEPTYDVNLDANPEFNSSTLRYNFSSLKTPATVVDYDMGTRNSEVKKVQPVLGNFSSDNYETEFVWTKARDGVMVPVSLVYKKGLPRNGSAPCYLIGYGSYGASYDPAFNRDIVSLLDRGFIFGIAHIRGGMELGFNWYEDGKMMKKMNTFNDFIDCSEMLIREKYTSADRLFASGRSAGGLLMGAITNMRPDLYKGIITGVPFVDVLTTMSDPSIPLTTGEYTEWGNPAIKEQFDYMKQYSPYDNLQAKNYPNLLVITSFSDSQVQYFEPAKYVAKMRELKTDNNVLLLKTNMTGSHGGSSGRFERVKERALEYAWMLGLMGEGERRKGLEPFRR